MIKSGNTSFVTFSRLGHVGELGNQMFQIATVMGYASKWGKTPIFPKWQCKISGNDYSSGIFKNPIDQSFTPEMQSRINNKIKYDGLTYKELKNQKGNVDFLGYFQSEKYFSHCEKDIKHFFEPSDEIVEYISNKYKEILSEPNKISLQVRTGKRGANDYDVHAYSTIEFIEKCQAHFEDGLFVVFADNLERAKEVLPSGRKYFFIEGEKNYIDLFMMNMFKNYIVAPSTFGWWGAWLSQSSSPKITIMKDWFQEGKPKAYLNKNNDQVPEKWIKI
jgi:hypothetical protein